MSFRFDVCKRDGFRCRLCGRKRKMRGLQVHHLAYGDYDDYFNPDLAITLCSGCHMAVGGQKNRAIRLSRSSIETYNTILCEMKERYEDREELKWQEIPLPPSLGELEERGKAQKVRGGYVSR